MRTEEKTQVIYEGGAFIMRVNTVTPQFPFSRFKCGQIEGLINSLHFCKYALQIMETSLESLPPSPWTVVEAIAHRCFCVQKLEHVFRSEMGVGKCCLVGEACCCSYRQVSCKSVPGCAIVVLRCINSPNEMSF